jgi:hypothetical protein
MLPSESARDRPPARRRRSGESVPGWPARVCRDGWRECAGMAGESVPGWLARVCRDGRRECARMVGESVSGWPAKVCRDGRRECAGMAGESVPGWPARVCRDGPGRRRTSRPRGQRHRHRQAPVQSRHAASPRCMACCAMACCARLCHVALPCSTCVVYWHCVRYGRRHRPILCVRQCQYCRPGTAGPVWAHSTGTIPHSANTVRHSVVALCGMRDGIGRPSRRPRPRPGPGARAACGRKGDP